MMPREGGGEIENNDEGRQMRGEGEKGRGEEKGGEREMKEE